MMKKIDTLNTSKLLRRLPRKHGIKTIAFVLCGVIGIGVLLIFLRSPNPRTLKNTNKATSLQNTKSSNQPKKPVGDSPIPNISYQTIDSWNMKLPLVQPLDPSTVSYKLVVRHTDLGDITDMQIFDTKDPVYAECSGEPTATISRVTLEQFQKANTPELQKQMGTVVKQFTDVVLTRVSPSPTPQQVCDSLKTKLAKDKTLSNDFYREQLAISNAINQVQPITVVSVPKK